MTVGTDEPSRAADDSTGASLRESARARRAKVIGSFFQDDSERILSVAFHLRGPGRVVASTVRGCSMGDTIPDGAEIRIELPTRDHYQVGEVVALLIDSEVVVHRVVHQGRRHPSRHYVITRGDARLSPDPPCRQALILGPVRERRDLRGNWVPLGIPRRQSLPARGLSSVLLAVVSGVLDLNPRAARSVLVGGYRFASSLWELKAKVSAGVKRGHAPRAHDAP